MKGEKPWQSLAVIYELHDALQSGCPESFQSRISVHQDGSCNGLQHYAALMRDKCGGVSVNLYPSERKCDVYTDVMNIVKEKNLSMANVDRNFTAQQVHSYIDRKTIKQSVMTTVYGVTLVGARDQIKKQLEEKNFPDKTLMEASMHLAKLTINSLGDLFPAGEKLKVISFIFFKISSIYNHLY